MVLSFRAHRTRSIRPYRNGTIYYRSSVVALHAYQIYQHLLYNNSLQNTFPHTALHCTAISLGTSPKVKRQLQERDRKNILGR
mmetsp:Transcript_23261/g.47408  ORF Transcript_23261/g.47408 Transcript_23261/m.47408 type:complete len:83 (+) Transcript_23261:195-443(+)